ncbi:MAG TPA: response regulator [Opitutaceae bacterium]|nr:response regulator [Opitutaceae bacterium]
MNILIVDDQPNIARVTALALELLGCRTFTAQGTAGAAGVLATERIDAVFLDVNLRGESGLEYLSQLVARPHHPPVILFTAGDKEEFAAEARRRGAFNCLSKPFSPEDLRAQIARIEQHLRRRAGALAGQAAPA